MNNYAAKQKKKDAVDGIQTTVRNNNNNNKTTTYIAP